MSRAGARTIHSALGALRTVGPATLATLCFLPNADAQPPAADAAEGDAPEATQSYVRARLLTSTPPRVPAVEARRGREGWVVVSYVVTEDGSIIEKMIEDSSGNENFEKAALAALDDWEYEPAQRNGEPVEQSMTRMRFVFQLERRPGQRSGAGPRFVRSYNEITEVIADGDLDDAADLIADLEFTERQNLYEDAWFWWLKYQYLAATGAAESREASDALRRAIGYEEEFLNPDAFVAAVERLFALQTKTLDFSAAINTFERLQNASDARRSDYYDSTSTRLDGIVAQMRAVIASPQILQVEGYVSEHGYWVHDLLRRDFSLADVTGSVDIVDIRCERGTARYESISEGNTWHVPDSWGKCGVYVGGSEGTTFEFHEYPAAAAQ